MGISASASVNKTVQTAVTESYQRAQNSCTANCSQLQQGNVIVLDNTTAGDITFTQRCEAEASCYMDNSLDALVEAYQNAESDATAKPAFFPGIQVNATVNSTTQEIKNELTQIMENLCSADVNQVIQDNIVYATDSTVGNIGFLQEGNASASCVMENAGRLTAQMKQDGKSTATSGTYGAGITGIIVLVIVIVVIVWAIGKFNKNKGETRPRPTKRPAVPPRPSGAPAVPARPSASAISSTGESLSSLLKRRGR